MILCHIVDIYISYLMMAAVLNYKQYLISCLLCLLINLTCKSFFVIMQYLHFLSKENQ